MGLGLGLGIGLGIALTYAVQKRRRVVQRELVCEDTLGQVVLQHLARLVRVRVRIRVRFRVRVR